MPVNLAELFVKMKSLPDTAPAVDKQRRGREFEVFLRDLLDESGLFPRVRIRPKGEEIDGSFVLDGRAFLLEAKWHANTLAASSIYQFKGKVDGKLVGTIGVFISISGYSEETVNALAVGKELNVILFDRADIEASMASSFAEVLRTKLRAAAEEGVVYLPTQTTVASAQSTKLQPIVTAEQPGGDVLVVVEGAADQQVLAEFARRIAEIEGLTRHFRFISAGGKLAISGLVEFVAGLAPSKPLIVVADTDGDRSGTLNILRAAIETPNVYTVLIEPELEAWLVPVSDERPKAHLRHLAMTAQTRSLDYAVQQARIVSVRKLKEDNTDFAAFYDALMAAAQLGSTS